ncbi:MAG: SUMF1/EgtB/PvdO family nonheme iron enzyme [Chitinophagaceae bacterium]|nr:SUMF1/EgtB/PvdO family nonheme iron enzyme [Chitinophagaceae bacterium]
MLSRFLILTCFSLPAFYSFSQKNKISKKVPPGTVKVNDTLFVDETEISNLHWREYLFYLEKFDSTSIEKALPDTSVWRNTVSETLTGYYLRQPSFNNYPVVGISYEQAVVFCQWRSDRVNELNSKKPENERSFKKITYRLLSKQEWESIAAGKLSVEKYPYGCDSVYTKWNGRTYMKSFNCKFLSDPFVYHHWGAEEQITTPINAFFRNSSHTYNMIGNVAEMVSEKGIAKGGSFDHTLEECKIINDQYYTKPERWLGFRCVAIVVR